MNNNLNITIQKTHTNPDKLKKIMDLMQQSFDSDSNKVKVLYDSRLFSNAKYINNHLVCSNCESDITQFKFIAHAIDNKDKEREIHQCQSCGQYIFTLYDYQGF